MENCLLFKDLNKEEIEAIINNYGYIKYYKKGEYIFHQEDKPKDIFILDSGKVQVEKIDEKGKRTIANVFKEEGTIFGEVYLFIDHPYDYGCLALKDSRIIHINKDFLSNENIYKDGLKNNMLNILSEKAFYLNQKLLILAGMTLREKLINYLNFKEEDGLVELDLTRGDLADYLSTTRPSISRELIKMEEDGLIEISESIIKIL